MKKGQITLIFIVGVIILIGVFIGVFFRDEVLDLLRIDQNKNLIIPEEIKPINEFILDCINYVGQDGLVFIGEHGGYFDTSKVISNSNKVPYYLINKKLFIPSKEQIQNNLGLFLNYNIKNCLKDFSLFNKKYQISDSKISSKVTIFNDKVNFYLKYPVKIKFESNSYELKYFSVDIDNHLGTIYDITSSLMNKQMNESTICLSCAYDLVVLNNFTVDIYNPSRQEVEYVFKDDLYLINNKSYEYIIAIRLEE